jgi:hypothetical protein
MMYISPTKLFTCLFLLALTVAGAGCSFDKAAARPARAETVRNQPTESPTPGYKPLKRVSRDVIDTDKKEEPIKIKAKK